MILYSRQLENGDIAIGCFNMSENKGIARLNLDELGLPFSTGRTLKLKEVWTGEESIVKNSTLIKKLEPFDCAVYRAEVIKA